MDNKLKIKVLEEADFAMQTFRLPTKRGRNWQEKQIDKIYNAASKGRKIEGLPKKDYQRF